MSNKQARLKRELFGELIFNHRDDMDWSWIKRCIQRNEQAVRWKGDFDRIPLHFACQKSVPLDVAEEMLTLWRGSVNERDESGDTPLHCACMGDTSFEVIEALIQAGPVTVRMSNNERFLPLHVACMFGQSLDVIRLLVWHYPRAVYRINRYGKTPFDIARAERREDIIQWWEEKEREAVAQIFEAFCALGGANLRNLGAPKVFADDEDSQKWRDLLTAVARNR